MVKTGRIYPSSELFLPSFHGRSIVPISRYPKQVDDMQIVRKEEKRKEMGLSDQSEGRSSLRVTYISRRVAHALETARLLPRHQVFAEPNTSAVCASRPAGSTSVYCGWDLYVGAES